MLAVVASINAVEAKALTDGVYVAPVSVDYRNPETGVIEDGGSEQNYQLGLSMCQCFVGLQALIEVEIGKTYVTLRFSLMSNINGVSISTQSSPGGSYYSTSATSLNPGNDRADYRFEVTDPSYYISPSMYVVPMSRNVKFFVKVNVNSAVAGSGDFITTINNSSTASSNTVDEQSNTTEVQAVVENDTSTNEEVDTASEIVEEDVTEDEDTEEVLVAKEEINLDEVEGITEYKVDELSEEVVTEKDKKSNKGIILGAVISVVVIAAGGVGFYVYKKRMDKSE